MSKYYGALIAYDTIVNAIEQDEKALIEIVNHYRKYIKKLSLVTQLGEDGEWHTAVNPDIEANLEADLLLGVLKFKIKT